MNPQIHCRRRSGGDTNLDGSLHDHTGSGFQLHPGDSYAQTRLEPNAALPQLNYAYCPVISVPEYCDIEPPLKKTRLSAVDIQPPSYTQVTLQTSGDWSGLCSFHQQTLGYLNPWQGTDMAIMEFNGSPLTKKLVELGLSICPCCYVEAQPPEGYILISDFQAMQDPNQQYITEKAPFAPFGTDHIAACELPPGAVDEQTRAHAQAPALQQVQVDQPSLGQYNREGRFPSPRGAQTEAYNHNIAAEFGPWQPHGTVVPPGHNFNEGTYTNQYDPPPPFIAVTPYPGSDAVNVSHADEPPRLPLSSVTIVPAHGHSGRGDAQWNTRQHGKRGPFRDTALRKETAYTRKIGCCIRCRMQRIRCDMNPEDPDGICLTCKKVANVKTGRLPCLRFKIADVKLFKPGQVPGYEWTRRWANGDSEPIQTWLSSEIKTLTVSEGYSDSPLTIRVRKFLPQDGDKLDRSWVYQGQKRSVQVPPYALIDMDEARIAYEDYINKAIPTTIHKVIGPPRGLLYESLLYKTYKHIACVFRRKELSREARALLQSALKLWMSARLTTISCFIVGEETLGMPQDILDETSPTPGKVPLPPVLGAQLDMVLIHGIQKQLRKDVLDQLQRMVQKNKTCNWLVTYLVAFILLHNASLIIAHDAGYARKHGIKRRFARETMVKEYHLGANILLAHFHYCNKGTYPLSADCTETELKDLAELNDEDLSFIRWTQQYAKCKNKEWKTLRESDAYDDTCFYICQLFEQGWKPRTMA